VGGLGVGVGVLSIVAGMILGIGVGGWGVLAIVVTGGVVVVVYFVMQWFP
jgi:hypothetical protein